jgi:hypothetical protein
MRGGQKYRYDGLSEYMTQREDPPRYVYLARVTTRCADCGQAFEFKTTKSNLHAGALNRRCDLHKKPGDPVDRNLAAKRRRLLQRRKPRRLRPVKPQSAPARPVAPLPIATSPAPNVCDTYLAALGWLD